VTARSRSVASFHDVEDIDVVMREEIWVGQTIDGIVVASGLTKRVALSRTTHYAMTRPHLVRVRVHSSVGRFQRELDGNEARR
jgi:hypothetical protein